MMFCGFYLLYRRNIMLLLAYMQYVLLQWLMLILKKVQVLNNEVST